MEDTLPIPPRELNGKRLFGYSMGDLGMPLVNIFTGIYLFQFYVYTINLDAILVSVGIFAQLFLDALFAIIFGVIVDNKKPGKLGKRRPFLLIGLPIWITVNILVWLPPRAPQGNSLFLPTTIFFWSIVVIRSLSRSLLFNVYISMLPEQSQTLKNREKVASVRSAFSIIASVVALLLPSLVSSLLPNTDNVKWWTDSGRIVTTLIPLIGAGFSIFGFLSVLSIFFSVDENFHNSYGENQHRKVTISGRFRQMSIPLKDISFLYIVMAGFFAGLAGRTLGTLIFPFQFFVMEFEKSQFLIYPAISIIGKFGWYFLWIILRKWTNVMKSYSAVMTLSITGSFMGTFFLIPNLPFGIEVALYSITWSTVLGSMYSAPLFSIPLTAALVHEAAANSGEPDIDVAMSKISGSYYGLASFVRSLGPAFISLIIGFILSGENQSNPTIMVLLWVAMGFFYLAALICIRKIKVKNLRFLEPQIEKDKIIEV